MAGVTRIAIDVHAIDQLFSSFDPSPFHEFSLNGTAAQYIASQAWYAPRGNTFAIELCLRGRPASRKDAALVEESSASAYSLEDQAIRLMHQVEFFDVGEGESKKR